MPKKGASMEEGVGLQCQRAEVNVKERSKQKGEKTSLAQNKVVQVYKRTQVKHQNKIK